jgi:hypothetical protein
MAIYLPPSAELALASLATATNDKADARNAPDVNPLSRSSNAARPVFGGVLPKRQTAPFSAQAPVTARHTAA